jgi:hypothetical protein
MKKLSLIFLAVWVAVNVRAALPDPNLLARIHFAGGQTIAASSNFMPFTNEFASAEALVLRQQTAVKLAQFLGAWLPAQNGAKVIDGAAKLRPLLDDLQNCEWFLEARLAGNGQPVMSLLVKLDNARTKLWQANLAPFFPTGSFKPVDGWLLFASAPTAPALARKPDAAWLTADLNWPRLVKYLPALAGLGLPETQFSVAPTGADLKINGKFLFPENLAIKLDAWCVPTNTLRQPFVSFTAVRGISAWLKTQPWALPYQINPAPNQYFVWALPQVPFQTFAAYPVADSLTTLKQLYSQLEVKLATANAKNEFMMPFSLVMTNREISLRGMPFIAPTIEAVSEPAGQFIVAAGFPNVPRSKPLPPELFTRLGQKNLVFYHWEITAERFPAALNLSQFGLMMTSHKQLSGDSASMKWIQRMGGSLGNTVTEVFQTAPDQMTFTRRAPGIFTAGELLALGNWLEATNFPGCDLKLPPPKKKPRRPATAPSAVSVPSAP